MEYCNLIEFGRNREPLSMTFRSVTFQHPPTIIGYIGSYPVNYRKMLLTLPIIVFFSNGLLFRLFTIANNLDRPKGEENVDEK